ncbi:MANBL protein, partial [Amia calva]|nr:MANBL protein [Amia calva]
MATELNLSPPDVPEPTFLESVLRYGLFLGALFQLVCILAIIIPSSKAHDQVPLHVIKDFVHSPPPLMHLLNFC